MLCMLKRTGVQAVRLRVWTSLDGDACSALRFLVQTNALRAGALASDADAAGRWEALGGLAGPLPTPAEAADLYRRLVAATLPSGGPSATLVTLPTSAT